ncbi:MAG TPA: hypothetical protein VJU83_09760 [Burkholderiales bacterium]|nr:hypothetical protein [Burkholderiales bacterium]
MKRRDDWPHQLADCIKGALERPFCWGSFDCCFFAAAAVQAMTGVDFAAPYQGRYQTAIGAARLINKLGGVQAIATAALGLPIDVRQAGRGDVLMVTRDGQQSLGVCTGKSVAFPTLPAGLVFVPLTQCECAWRV